MNTLCKKYQVDTSKIGFVRFIFEGHEGLAGVTTLDSSRGLIRLAVPPERMETVDMVINDLKKDMLFHEV